MSLSVRQVILILVFVLAPSVNSHGACVAPSGPRISKLEILVKVDSCRSAIAEATLVLDERGYGQRRKSLETRWSGDGLSEGEKVALQRLDNDHQRHIEDIGVGVLVEARARKSWSRIYTEGNGLSRSQKPTSAEETRTFYLPDIQSCNEVSQRMVGKWDRPCCDQGSAVLACTRPEFFTLRNVKSKQRRKDS